MATGGAGVARAVKAARKMAGPASIRIRMYRVGFGDCFLVSLPVNKSWKHILVDCGVHSRGDIGTIEKAVDHIEKETGGKLALVIGTHAHQDHISGFEACEKAFLRFEIDEVWLPWTENPKDAIAVKLNAATQALTETVVRHLAARPASEKARAAVDAALHNLTGNAGALQLLKAGFSGATVRYIEAGKSLEDAAGIKGLSVRFLGPPRDEKALARMNPPMDERFFHLNDDGVEEAVNAVVPFETKWQVKASSNPYYAALDEREKNLLAVAATNAEGLAFALDRAMNNTSIVALLSFGGKNLLFPGDAQYGSWQSWIDQPATAALLADVNFYKVSHHGSENATPRSAVARMTSGLTAAMCSTQGTPWESIPEIKILDALTAKGTSVVRSDSLKVKNAPDGPVLARLAQGFKRGEFWFDYFLAVKAGKTRAADQ